MVWVPLSGHLKIAENGSWMLSSLVAKMGLSANLMSSLVEYGNLD